MLIIGEIDTNVISQLKKCNNLFGLDGDAIIVNPNDENLLKNIFTPNLQNIDRLPYLTINMCIINRYETFYVKQNCVEEVCMLNIQGFDVDINKNRNYDSKINPRLYFNFNYLDHKTIHRINKMSKTLKDMIGIIHQSEIEDYVNLNYII